MIGRDRRVNDEGEVDGSYGDEMRRIKQTQLGTIGVVDDGPWKETLIQYLVLGRGTHQAVFKAEGASSSCPSPVPQYRGPSSAPIPTPDSKASPSSEGVSPLDSCRQSVSNVRYG